ncbi:polysaccharide synthase [Colletotrichum navitas]|uniref:Polysaccharide synthase n=1 Tax=Colletotrichum navitas TaxID=681940 RepID=A0AAD8V2M9_9PEZI|nr:polysaccharide synthase [Colletotrichum navitas]KAK1585037.1 polysaccharide synthase [Colletotrichum navitas]
MALVLAALWAWSLCYKAVISYNSKKYKPQDVSITESTFTECLRLWLGPNAREIVIVTVKRNRDRVERLVEPLKENADRVVILCAPLANKRIQLVVGVKAARGSILALVDDDVYWRAEGVLPYLLAPFGDTKVGTVAGIQSAEVPPERQSSRVITAWEATSTFDLCQWKASREVLFAADGGCWCLSARTLLIRASILQDPSFIKAHTQEVIGRRMVNTADDVVLTGWVFDRGWKVSIQNVLEAEITTNITHDHRFAWQILRWDRGNFRTFLGYISVYPGFRKLMQRHLYTTFEMIERLARPIWALAYAGVWLQTLRAAPWIAAFLKKYPYCRRQVWAFLLMDFLGPIVDVYVYFTMNNGSKLTRTADT